MGKFTQKEDESAPFNMAALFYLEIHKVREIKSTAMINNEFSRAYDCLQELLTLGTVKLKQHEEKKVAGYLKKAKAEFSKKENRDLGKVKEHLIKADRDLLKYMNKYNMIFPRVELTGGLRSIREKYLGKENDGKD